MALTADKTKLSKRPCRHALRNLTILEICIRTAARVATVASLNYGQVCDEKGNVRSHLEVDKQFMKGKKRDAAWAITGDLAACIKKYVSDQPFAFKQTDPLFFSDRSKGKDTDTVKLKRLHRAAICNLFHGYFLALDIADAKTKRALGMHSFRKTGLRYVWDATHDINAVARMADHTSTQVTERYLPFIRQEKKDELSQGIEDQIRKDREAKAKAQEQPKVEAPKAKKRKPEPESDAAEDEKPSGAKRLKRVNKKR